VKLYERWVFPWILDQIDGPQIQALREQCLRQAAGNVLEIGIGTGKTLPHYSSKVKTLTAIEPNPAMMPRLQKQIDSAPFPVEMISSNGPDLPFDSERFDAVVVSLVLCSVPDPAAMLREVYRVLHPKGRLHFLEHVASSDPKQRQWQNRLNGIQRIIGCGCNLNRPTADAITAAGFQFESIDHRVVQEMPLFPELFPFIFGTAKKRPDQS
jgi:ubiquinone/menaquinone biosynthesis C-methylase UbiE